MKVSPAGRVLSVSCSCIHERDGGWSMDTMAQKKGSVSEPQKPSNYSNGYGPTAATPCKNSYNPHSNSEQIKRKCSRREQCHDSFHCMKLICTKTACTRIEAFQRSLYKQGSGTRVDSPRLVPARLSSR